MEKQEICVMWNGFYPESQLKGKKVRLRLNQSDFFESEESGLQICVWKACRQPFKSQGKGKFRTTPGYADEIENGEILSPQNTARPPFNDPAVLFQSSGEIENYIHGI